MTSLHVQSFCELLNPSHESCSCDTVQDTQRAVKKSFYNKLGQIPLWVPAVINGNQK